MSNKYTEKRKESNKRYKSQLSRVDVWLTPEEKITLKAKAQEENKSLSGYLRSCAGLNETPIKKNEQNKEEAYYQDDNMHDAE